MDANDWTIKHKPYWSPRTPLQLRLRNRAADKISAYQRTDRHRACRRYSGAVRRLVRTTRRPMTAPAGATAGQRRDSSCENWSRRPFTFASCAKREFSPPSTIPSLASAPNSWRSSPHCSSDRGR